MGNLSEKDYKKIRERVEERFEKRTELATHFIAYLFVNIGLHIFFGIGSTVPLMVSVFWGMGLVIHATQVLFETGMEQAKERAVQREIEMQLYHKEGRIPSFINKRKNEDFSNLRIGYDGELVSADDEEYAADADYQGN